MISRQELFDILTVAVHAPSGDNAQPWEFKEEDGVLFVYNKPDADETLYNFKQRGSFVAHGALLENISLLAKARGYEAQIQLFPALANCVARISFVPTTPHTDELLECITERTTNRKPYNKARLQVEHAQTLREVSPAPNTSFSIVEDRMMINALAKVLSLNEELLVENRGLHDFLFGIIRWSPEEERQKPGLFVRTMELPPPVRLLFRYVLRHWKAAQVLTLLKFPRLISSQTTQLYASSSALGVITVENASNESFISAGRTLQRVWLTATRLGVALQPVTGLPYLASRIIEGGGNEFSAEHARKILDANNIIRAKCAVSPGAQIGMLVRLGYGDNPSARSYKFPPVFVA